MNHTPKNVLRILQRSGRHGLTIRQLRVFRAEDLLPRLQEGTKAGTNKREYFWTEPDIIKRAALLHDLLEGWTSRHQEFYLPLWLLGFDVPFERIHRLFLLSYDQGTAKYRESESDEEDVYVLLNRILTRWKYDPRPSSMTTKYGAIHAERLQELWLCLLTNAEFLIDEEMLSTLFLWIPGMRFSLEKETQNGQQSFADQANQVQQLFERIRSIVALPILFEVIKQATEEEWTWALQSYQEAIELVCTFLRMSTRVVRVPPLPRRFFYNMLVETGMLGVPILLSLRRNGFEEWINNALGKGEEFLGQIQEWVNSPEFQEQMRSPQIQEQLSQQIKE